VPKVINRVGQKFGRLIVTARAPGRTLGGNVLWIADCDCGTVGHVISSNAFGQTKSCGCLRGYYYGPPSRRGTPLTQARLQELLRYDLETGEFFWCIDKSGSAKTGDRAGNMNGNGYWEISVDGKKYKAHRLAWLYVYGYFSERLDHKNRNKSDNRITNLREATRSQNGENARAKRTNRTGLKGVSRHAQRWQAKIGHNGKRAHLGTYDTARQAHTVYCYAAKLLHGKFFHNGSTS
jgi:HNH endonuclease